MPSLTAAIPALREVPVIGIVRGCPPDRVADLVGSAVAQGIGVVEVTLDSPAALDQIRTLSRTFPDVVVGAGTVTRPDEVAAAVDAGARFVVGPVVRPGVITACTQRDVPCIPGAATPTEILDAWEAGATAVKVFPAAPLGGPAFLRALRAPLGGPPLVPTGGVRWEDAAAYLEAGAVALGVGGGLFPAEAVTGGDLGEVEARARRWVEVVAR